MERKKIAGLFFCTLLLAATTLSVAGTINNQQIKTLYQQNSSWTKTYGGAGDERCWYVQQTLDEGYIVAGDTTTNSTGGFDGYLFKVDANGTVEWEQTYGGTGEYDQFISVQQTNDGGFIAVGETESIGNGGTDVWLIKTDSDGNKEWEQTYGGSENDDGWSVAQTDDGGYIISGYTISFAPADTRYIWVIKTNDTGSMTWNKTFGKEGYTSESGCIHQTNDGGYIVSGYTYSYKKLDLASAMVIKLDAAGNEIWTQMYKGTRNSIIWSIENTPDNGFIIGGTTAGNIFGIGGSQAWMIKINISGTVEWEKSLGRMFLTDCFWWIIPTKDNGYIGAGTAFGIGAFFLIQDFCHPYWSKICIYKTNATGEKEWAISPSTGVGRCVQQTSDDGYIIAGITGNIKNGGDIILIKTDSDGQY
jgi:predicted secreted protein